MPSFWRRSRARAFAAPLRFKSEAAQEARILLKARAHLVRQRRDTENAIRGLLGSLGLRFPKGAGKLAGRVRTALAARPELRATIEPLLSTVATLKREIERLDKAVMARAKAAPACRLLMSVPGARAGHGAGLCRDHRRPEPVRQIARGGGLSGDDDAALSVRGNGLLGAHIQARRRHGAQPALRGGQFHAHGGAQGPSLEGLGAAWIRRRSGHKKACVALARTLAVILHRMLTTGEPFRWPEKKDA